MSCGCKCHAGGPHATCDAEHDTGSSGVPGKPSCSPCAHSAETEGESAPEPCRHCEQPPGAHVPVDGDCALRHRYDNRDHPPLAKIGWCCRGCVQRHRDWLRQIVDLWATLPEVVPLGSVPDNTAHHDRPRKQPASPAPFRVMAWAMLFGRIHSSVHPDTGDPVADRTKMIPARLGAHLPNVPDVLEQWAQRAVNAGATPTGAHTNLSTVSAAVHQLRSAADHIAAQEWVVQYDAELLWVRRALRTAHGIDSHKPLGRCLEIRTGRDCGGFVWPAPGERPTCDRCGRRYGPHDLMRLKVEEDRRGQQRQAG